MSLENKSKIVTIKRTRQSIKSTIKSETSLIGLTDLEFRVDQYSDWWIDSMNHRTRPIFFNFLPIMDQYPGKTIFVSYNFLIIFLLLGERVCALFPLALAVRHCRSTPNLVGSVTLMNKDFQPLLVLGNLITIDLSID